jgi:hypothetical protein
MGVCDLCKGEKWIWVHCAPAPKSTQDVRPGEPIPETESMARKAIECPRCSYGRIPPEAR